MSSQPPTYNIYFVAGNVSREHFLRPSTPAGRPVLNISVPNPAPRRPPLPPGQLFTGSGQVAPPRPPVPSRAPGLLASAVARGRSRSPSRGTVSTASRVSVTRPESPPPGNWHNGGIWQPPQYSAAPHLPFSVWPLENQNSRAGVVENVSGNQIDLRAWLRSRQDVQYPLEESFVKYLTRILDQSAISPDQLTDLRLLEYDPQTHENYPEDVSPKRYYILRGFFSQRSIPDPIRAAPALSIQEVQHIQLAHATTVGGLTGIIRSGAVAPSRVHHHHSNSFFCLSSKRTGHIQWDRSELSRLIHQAWNSTKNTARIIILALGWGSAEAVRSGGELACIARTLNGGAVHHKSGRLWVVHTDSHFLQGLAFKTDAVDPAAAF